MIKNTLRELGLVMSCCCIFTGVLLAGCGKVKNIPVFKYDVNEDNTASITGLTDKGKLDSKITIPAQIDGHDVVAVNREAFRDNNCVTSVEIAQGVRTIAENAFLNCTSLENISFPSTVTEIGTSAVKNTKWESDRLKDADQIVVNSILVEVKPDVTEYKIPDEVKYIASGVFYNNKSITKIEIGSQVEKIGSFAFSGCTSLNEIELPDSIKSIGYSAFSDAAVKDIKIPEGVEKIDSEAFLNIDHIQGKPDMDGFPWGAKTFN